MSEVSTPAGPDAGERRSKTNRVFIVFFAVIVVLVIIGTFLMFQRRSQYQALAEETEAATVPTVSVVHAIAEAGDENLVLPGTLQAYVESPIYARTNGYLRKWYHDIGSRVAKGELLAEIDTPEVDQQYAQAKADLSTAEANLQLAQITAARNIELLKTNAISKQEADNSNGDLAAKKAIKESAEANLRRLQELKSFQRVVAPFSGVITKRNIDTGTLINSGNGGTAQQLFTLAQTDPIRVFINVPETSAPSIRSGIGAYIELPQYPGQKFQGKVVRTAESIDLATRTLYTEVDVPNKSGQLLPGGFAQVHLEVKATGQRLQVPVNALLFRSEGLRAVVIDSNQKARLRPIVVGRDYGTTLEVLGGLSADDWIVLNPPDSLEDGQSVHMKQIANPMTPFPAKGAPAPAPKKS
ncbi:MAG TPA: efflux RND transporter periplasmic adaptor subunit [Candidatus Acidoferrum sp.]|nr:efflux RND transporter periplasmic adaptor subunit [Candidatus Acidoferrum sp.]